MPLEPHRTCASNINAIIDLSLDGDEWGASIGPNLAEGISGWGKTRGEALRSLADVVDVIDGNVVIEELKQADSNQADHVCLGCTRDIKSGELHIHLTMDEFAEWVGLPTLGLDDVLKFACCEQCSRPGGMWTPESHDIGVVDAS